MPRSLQGSPVRKRQRLSSPTYDEQVPELTQEDLAAFDAIEHQLSQQRQQLFSTTHVTSSQQFIPGPSQQAANADVDSSQPQASFSGFINARAMNPSLHDDPDNPFRSSSSPKKIKPFVPPLLGFSSASKIQLPVVSDDERPASPEGPPPEPDYDKWFDSGPTEISAAFVTSNFSTGSTMMGFTRASKKGDLLPSKRALEKAKAMFDSWNNDDNEPNKPQNDENADVMGNLQTFGGFKLASSSVLAQSPKRKALSPVKNATNTPATPTPNTTFTRPPTNSILKEFSSPNPRPPTQFKPPFKLPNQSKPTLTTFNSPLNPNRPKPSLGFSSASSQHIHPLSGPPINASSPMQPLNSNPSLAFTTPLRPKAPGTGLKIRPTPFKTPFKPGMEPGAPGRLKLGQSSKLRTPQVASTLTPASRLAVPRPVPPTTPSNLPRRKFFDLTPRPDRISLKDSGLEPLNYSDEQLEYFGVNTTILSQITPETAMYFSFHTTESSPPPATLAAPTTLLGPAAALQHLLDRGCSLATKPWVDNHWCLILWKLAGMVVLDPEKEKNPDTTRWCWSEVMRQLLYRYERELNNGTRPPLRKIANQDAPAAYPMLLCVSNIFWSPPGISEDGVRIEPHPELEVTDGWYRLRAEIDLPMARAVRKGTIRIGRKLGVAGARLSTEKKEPTEVLEAYNSAKLVFSGNSSQLMPWHAKLGFMRGPCISTLHSLSHDGGGVSALDFVITQTHPIAFLEYKEDEKGKTQPEGPRNEVEENQVNEKWKRKYEMEASKLRAESEKKRSHYEGYIERLERKAGNNFQPGEEDYPPDNIDSLYDELEYPDSANAVISRVTSQEAGWLARFIRKQVEDWHEKAAEDIEKEMKTICPPRSVRSFRVLIVQDSKTVRRPANRKAQLTVWDVLGLTLDEGSRAGGFEVGQRFLVTNLVPKQCSAWMDQEPGSEIFLCTGRGTKWMRIKGVDL